MEDRTFRALVLEERDGGVEAELRELAEAALPAGEVLVRVAYSDLNYKDGLAVSGKARVVRSYPMVPGIDLVGTVERSEVPDYRPDDRVLINGWGLGETHWGGYSQLERVQSGWLVPVPDDLTLAQAAGIGTAGFTAMLAVMALEGQGMVPQDGEVVVTGASGGVGSLAVAILANLGYRVVASTGSAEAHQLLRDLGAAEVMSRDVLAAPSPRPLESGRWAGAVDTVGGDTLAGLLRGMRPRSGVAACGNAGGNELHTSVLPFILRGVNLLGIDSNTCPRELRLVAWSRLSRELPRAALARVMRTAPLAQVPELAGEIVQGKINGRVVIDVNA